ncbi:hypothetical protein P389DRAFT_178052 [Cystobasidium minutum MCA 4210]|uniref:uncharacterized protein n=1 Tax=Cystobasidium minutum MCA 4210 TaxID=1397322 RepID=UPI0034CE0142|eukprot:jgi/Rhomi1/178052/fgenesh1_pg.2_\
MAPLYQSPEALAAPATQREASEVLIPCLVGWSIQFFLSAVVADRSIRILRTRNKPKFRITSLARPLFIVASLCNLIVGFICLWNIGLYTISQDRSVLYITSYKLPDVLGLGFGFPTSMCTQIFMAIRCWKVTSKNKPLAALIGVCLLTAAFGAVWATVIVGMLQNGDLDDNQRIFIPTVIWLVGNVVTDLIITIVFTAYLARLKRGTTRSSTGSFANALIRLAFETCAIPLFVTLFSAVMRAISTISHNLAHVATASILFIPSLYILSFIYCVEGTANRKRLLEREQSEVAAGAAMSPPLTASSLSHMMERKRPAKMVLRLNEPVSTGAEQSNKTPLSWEPPLAWASTVEQDTDSLPKLTDEQKGMQASLQMLESTNLSVFREYLETLKRYHRKRSLLLGHELHTTTQDMGLACSPWSADAL